MPEDEIIKSIVKHLRERLNHIEMRQKYLSFLITKRIANEKLLQLETMNIVCCMPEIVDYLPEKPYTADSNEKCDFWFTTSKNEYWMEMKTRPTNYRKIGHARAITHGVEGVIEDAGRLRKIKKHNSKKYVMFAFYPIYEDSYAFFNRHLPRVSEFLKTEVTTPQISIEVGNARFNLYLVELVH